MHGYFVFSNPLHSLAKDGGFSRSLCTQILHLLKWYSSPVIFESLSILLWLPRFQFVHFLPPSSTSSVYIKHWFLLVRNNILKHNLVTRVLTDIGLVIAPRPELDKIHFFQREINHMSMPFTVILPPYSKGLVPVALPQLARYQNLQMFKHLI